MPIETHSDQPAVKLPMISVGWDFDKQGPVLKVDEENFRSWEMVVAVLQAGVEQAKFNQQICRVQQVNAAQQELANAQKLRRNLGI